MTCKQRIKGFTFERVIVNKFKEIGWNAERMWGSNGKSRGYPEEVDVAVGNPDNNVCATSLENPTNTPIWLQCKRVARFLNRKDATPIHTVVGYSDSIDGVVFKEDNQPEFILMKFEDFIKRYLPRSVK